MKKIDETKWISNYHGLELSPTADHTGRGNENGILFLAEYYMFKEMLGILTIDDKARFRDICIKMQSYRKVGEQITGCYDRGAGESLIEDEPRTPSHDNMTAISAFSFKHDMKFHKDMLAHGRKYFWRFDNWDIDEPRWSRIMHPRDIIMWGFNGGSIVSKLFLPLLGLLLIQGCYSLYKVRNGQKILKTDGQLLTFVRVYFTKDKSWGMKAIGWCCHKMLEWRWGKDYFKQIFETYFKDPEHPIRILMEEVVKKDIKWYK